jgi:hypothetical protein
MKYSGAIVPDDDPDYVWIEKTDEERAAELHAKKARIIQELGLTPEEAVLQDRVITIDALEPEDGIFTVPRHWEETLLEQFGQEAVDDWRRSRARAGKKRILRSSLE